MSIRIAPSRPMRRADQTRAAVLVAALAGCGLGGAPVPECQGSGAEERIVAIVSPPRSTDEQRPLTIECWREIGSERIELWFSYPAGSDCWQLASAELRESAEAIAISLAATQAPVCTVDPGAETLTQIELQAPVGDREVLDASGG
jgi:hypothetical protein